MHGCLSNLSSLSLARVGRHSWPPQMRRAALLVPFLIESGHVYDLVSDRQCRCTFLLCDRDIRAATNMLVTARAKLPTGSKVRPCMRAAWLDKQPADVNFLTERTIAAMMRILNAKKSVKAAGCAQVWLSSMSKLDSCPATSAAGGAASCTCIRCDAGSDAPPLNCGVPIEEQVRYVSKALPQCAFGDSCFRYTGSSRHAHRYTAICLNQNDLVPVLSKEWLDSIFLGASLLILQEEAEVKGLPFYVLLCEESRSFMGCLARPTTTAEALKHSKLLAVKIQKVSKILFLVNINNSHWVSVEVDVGRMHITIFDSMKSRPHLILHVKARALLFAHTLYISNHTPATDPQNALFEQLLASLPAEPKKSDELLCSSASAKLWTTSMVQSPQQPDQYNCGAFSFMHLRHRMLGLPVKMTGGSGDTIRLKMVFDVICHGQRYSTRATE